MQQAHIVVGVDGAAPSVNALRWAAREAEVQHAELTAVIVDSEVALGPYAPVQTEPPAQRRTSLRRVLHHTIVQALGPQPAVVIHERVEAGRVDEVLTRYSKGADLLVLGNGEAEQAESELAPTIGRCIRRANCHLVVVNGRARTH